MEVQIKHSGLRMILVNRESIRLLDESWHTLGVYFLLGPATDPDRYRAYVGKATSLRGRVKQHAKHKDWWNRVLMIASVGDGFNTAEIGWLEGRLYDVLNNAVACDLMNGNKPVDKSLESYEMEVLEKYIEPIMAALRSCGASPDTADQAPPPPPKHRRYTEKVSDLITAKLLKPDTVLQPLKKWVTATATVKPDGRLQVGSEIFDTPSAAAKAASGSTAEPGWDFWGAPSGTGSFVSLAKLREHLQGSTKQPDGGSPAPVDTVPSGGDPAPPRPEGNGTLADLVIAAGLSLPLRLHSKYLGADAEAFVQSDGTITFEGSTYKSPSQAASAAKRALGYAGLGKASANGWAWWRYEDAEGALQELAVLRQPQN